MIDSAVYVGGQNSKFFNTMLSTPETIPQMSTKSFNTYFSSAQTGQYIDTLKIYQSSTDSTGSGASIPRGAFAYGATDTLNDFTSSNAFSTTIANSWTKGAYAYPSSANGYVYFYGSNSSTYNPGRYIVTPVSYTHLTLPTICSV